MTCKKENIKERALALLANGYTVTATAQQCGVSRATISNMLNSDINFYNELQDIRESINEEITDNMRELYSEAVDYLSKALKDEEIQQQQKIAIALSIIKNPVPSQKLQRKSILSELQNI